MNNWYNSENWNNSSLSYNESSDVLYFDSTSEYEKAEYTVSVPDWASSFSLSFKAGNGHSSAKEGAKDTGYITVGTDSGIIAKTPMIQDNSTYISYTLHTAPIQTEQLFITAEAYNSYSNNMDFYFGGFDIEFYETVPDSFITEHYFLAKPTTEKVQNINNTPAFLPIIGIVLLAAFSSFCAFTHKKENEK